MDNGSEGPLIKLFNVACHEAKSEFKQLIFFEQIQRFQLEKKYKSEDEKYLKDKEKFLQQYFNNMKSEHKASESQKVSVLKELGSYIKNLVEEEVRKNKEETSNSIQIKSETHGDELSITSSNNSNNFNYNKVLNAITELKNNQQELINNVAALYVLKDEIYLDFGRIKDVLEKFQNQFREIKIKIKECQNENLLKSKTITSQNENLNTSNLLNDTNNENLDFVQNINKRLQIIENLELSNNIELIKSDIQSIKTKNEKNFNNLKACDKQIEERLYEKIRQRQKEIFDGFQNQDKKIINLDENYKRKFKEFDERCIKFNEQCYSINKRINELTEKITKKKACDCSEDIKKLADEVKENKVKEDERITNVTNKLNEKINKIDTQSEFMDNKITEIKKSHQKFESEVKTVQDKYDDIERSMKEVSMIAIDVNDRYNKLLENNENNAKNYSILESSVSSIKNNLDNYDLEKMKNNMNVMKIDVNNLLQDHFPKYKKSIEVKFTDAEKKFMARIGDVYKSINGYSQKVDVLNRKVDDRLIQNSNNSSNNQNIVKNFELINKQINEFAQRVNDEFNDFAKKVNEKNKSLTLEIESIKKENMYDQVGITNTSNVNHNVNREIGQLREYMKSEIDSIKIASKTDSTNVNQYVDREVGQLREFIKSEIDSIKIANKTDSTASTNLNRYVDGEIANINRYIDSEMNKLKKLILSIPTLKNDPNYITLQTFLTEILVNHWTNFENNWKKEFYKCVEIINSTLNKEKHMVLSPIVINIP